LSEWGLERRRDAIMTPHRRSLRTRKETKEGGEKGFMIQFNVKDFPVPWAGQEGNAEKVEFRSVSPAQLT